MRKLFTFLVLFLSTISLAHAADFYYLVDRDGRVIAKQTEPYTHVTGLESRGERQITSSKDFTLEEAVLKGGKIAKRELTAEELELAAAKKELTEEETLIRKRSRKIAMDSLRAEGIIFKRASE